MATSVENIRPEFLSLPAELRNVIYKYAIEKENALHHAPLLLRRRTHNVNHPVWPLSSHTNRMYFGLTQANRQVRKEFRPLWFRQARLRIHLHDLPYFIRTFFREEEDYTNAPKLLEISWVTIVQEQTCSVLPLLMMRIHCPTFVVKFVSHEIAQGAEFYLDGCEICESYYFDGNINEWPPDPCPHLEDRKKRWLEQTKMEYEYLDHLNAFLSHSHPKWLEYLRNNEFHHIRLEFENYVITVHMRIGQQVADELHGGRTLGRCSRIFLDLMGFIAADLWNYIYFEVSVRV
ncbi:hypothetical protein CC80DRAFT_505808 [Byssothecium circinans]|uniref:F-box domain-containing protein n=1 Tax=Byssothecium circinans TaxID=147558 RepID=A0A6A5TTA4_9PLEO|nr:hypothetical protein CC80DRAFT_505808 [Byssothecium circinans]